MIFRAFRGSIVFGRKALGLRFVGFRVFLPIFAGLRRLEIYGCRRYVSRRTEGSSCAGLGFRV